MIPIVKQINESPFSIHEIHVVMQKWDPSRLHDVNWKALQQAYFFADAFVHENAVHGDVARCDDSMMCERLQLTPFCLDKASIRKFEF